MNIRELYRELEERIPSALSCEWDNDGLMVCPDDNAPVKSVLVALDVTEEIVEQAIAGGFDLIVSHHPLIFRPLKNLDARDSVARKVTKLIQNGISVMSFHTRLDAVNGGVNDTLANLLQLNEVRPLGKEGIGRIGSFDRPMALEDFVELLKDVLNVPAVLVSDAGLPVQEVALLGGSGSDEVPEALAAGADTYLSGELAHHFLTDAPDLGINLVAAGHFHTESPVCDTLRKLLQELDDELSVFIADSNPIRML